MKQAVDAIYEKGVFKPLKKPTIADGQYVRLIVETYAEMSAKDMLELATEVYKGLSDEEVREIEAIALDRSNFLVEDDGPSTSTSRHRYPF